MNRGARQATVQWVTKSWTRLSEQTTTITTTVHYYYLKFIVYSVVFNQYLFLFQDPIQDPIQNTTEQLGIMSS